MVAFTTADLTAGSGVLVLRIGGLAQAASGCLFASPGGSCCRHRETSLADPKQVKEKSSIVHYLKA